MQEYAMIDTAATTKKCLRKDVGKLSRILIYYLLCMVYVLVMSIIVLVFYYGITGGKNGILRMLGEFNSYTDWMSIIGGVLGLVVILLYRRKKMFTVDLVKRERRMTGRSFAIILVFFMAAVFISGMLSNASEHIANAFGISFMEFYNSVDFTSSTANIIYASFIGPIIEEIVFRGAVLRVLEKYGKGFAIIISSMMFSLIHMNFTQGIAAFIAGLVLAYVAIEYAIKWSMALHIINNFVFSYLAEKYVNSLHGWLSTAVDYGPFVIAFIIAVALSILNRHRIKEYIRINRTQGKYYGYVFSSAWFIVFASICLGVSVYLISGVSSRNLII